MRKILVVLAVALAVGLSVLPVGAASGPPPGATNPAVTQANVASTVCKSGYAKTVRNVSNATKSGIYAAYGIPQAKKRLYVIDHLIPLEVGGVNSVTNLWPQLKADAKKKDVLENLMHTRVCAGTLTLALAQAAFTVNFSTLTPAATEPPTTEPPATDPPATEPPATEASVAPGGGATARCNDGTFSYAEHHQGACSSHGGVAEFYK